jgi:hypothetical protein
MLKGVLKSYRSSCNGECEKCPCGWDVAREAECLINPTTGEIRRCYTCLAEIILENMEEGK